MSGCYLFFFQAEDGIRDLVRSRGLGDVYKRQPGGRTEITQTKVVGRGEGRTWWRGRGCAYRAFNPVSYTHLTLPTGLV